MQCHLRRWRSRWSIQLYPTVSRPTHRIPLQAAKEHAEHPPARPWAQRKPAWVDIATDPAAVGAPSFDVAFRAHMLLKAAAAGASASASRQQRGGSETTRQQRGGYGATTRPMRRQGGIDVDAVSLRRMPNSTGRALLAEGRGARVKITRWEGGGGT